MNTEKFQLNQQVQNEQVLQVKEPRRWPYYLLAAIIILLLLISGLLFFTTSTFVVPNFINTESLSKEDLAINGTEDRVIVRQDDLGQLTLLTPQSIGVRSSPTFGGLTITNLDGNIKAVNGAFISEALDLSNTSEVMNSLTVLNGGTGLNAAPDLNQIMVGDGQGGYSLKIIQAGSNITIENTADGIVINSIGGSSSVQDVGTVKQINSGNGLAGGSITTSGTISINAPTCLTGERLSWNGTSFQCLLTSGSASNFFTGTSGNDFNIVSAGADHTFNLPNASTTARGLVTTGSQTFGGDKIFNNKVALWDATIGSDSIFRIDNSSRSQTSGTLYPLYVTTRNDTTGGLTRGIYSVVTTGAANNPGNLRSILGQIDYVSSATTASVMSATVGVTNITAGTVNAALGGTFNTTIGSGGTAGAGYGGASYLTNNGTITGRHEGFEVNSTNSSTGSAYEMYGFGLFANNQAGGFVEEDYIGAYLQSVNFGDVGGDRYGLYVRADDANGDSTVAGDKHGIHILNSGSGTGATISGSEYGLSIAEISGGGTANYGLYLAGASGANPYALWVQTGVSRFAQATEDFASLNIPESFENDNPLTPISGDLWWNGTNLYFYNGSSNIDLLAGGGGSSQWSDDGSDIYFNDYVGIGVTDPQERLHVDGMFRLQGSQVISNYLQIKNTDFPSPHGDYSSAGDFYAEGNALIGGLLTLGSGLKLSNTSTEEAGIIRWTGSDFEGWSGSEWLSFTSGGSGSSQWQDESGGIYYNQGQVRIPYFNGDNLAEQIGLKVRMENEGEVGLQLGIESVAINYDIGTIDSIWAGNFGVANYGTVSNGIIGLRTTVENSGAGTAPNIFGSLIETYGDGAVTDDVVGLNIGLFSGLTIGGNLYGARMQFDTANVVDNAYGLFISGLEDGAVNNYGLFIQEAFGGSGDNYSLFVEAGATYLGGNLRLNTVQGCGDALITTGDGTVECLTSDKGIKQNISNLDSSSSLSKVLALQGVSYQYKDQSRWGSQTEFGLIAQDVEAVAPEMVFVTGNGVKGVKYSQMVSLLIEAMKEQQNQINELDQRVTSLENGETLGTSTSGVATITAGSTMVIVNSTEVKLDSKILITPDQFVSYKVVNKIEGVSFIIEISQPSLSDVKFDYLILK